jgi:starch phosphorylase
MPEISMTVGDFEDFPHIPPRLSGLTEIAENLWWSWHPAVRMLFKMLNRQVWKESIHNPDKMLRELPAETLLAAAVDSDYLRHYDLVYSQFRHYLEHSECSILPHDCLADDHHIAYFSAEYGLHHSLPFYAGGLGFLAGDYIKECSDLGIPLVAVGFMYPEGYVKQRIRDDGWQEGVSQSLDREAAAINRVLDDVGKPLQVQVPLIEPAIFVSVWRVAVGRISLYLLDTDIDDNLPWNRSITSRLYTGDLEQRLRQEIVLGIGGSEVLQKLGIGHSVLHLNEGHAAFSILEKIRDQMNQGATFDQARQQVRDTTIFTTHTPVPAGHDVFPFSLIEKYFRNFWSSLGLNREDFLKLGVHPDQPESGFNMTAMALRLTSHRNGVSRKHGEVASHMWRNLWPNVEPEANPIEYVTNGVHFPTWIEPKMELLFNRFLAPDWLDDHDNAYLWELVEEIPDDELWKTHNWLKIKLLNVIRDRSRIRWSEENAPITLALTGGALLDPNVLTVGFARRFATYKRADLIFQDQERLRKILCNRWQPVQIIFAGKAHPADEPGKMVLQRIFNAARNPAFCGRIAFVEDYGEQFAQYLVHGVDVWLNNPVPPMEACGTSGMKASLNGVPNLSILDGWWLEGFTGHNGWAFGGESIDGQDRTNDDAYAIYRLLEEEIVPLYYHVDDDGIPHDWVRIMKNAIKATGARFSARRMVKEYAAKFYARALRKT